VLAVQNIYRNAPVLAFRLWQQIFTGTLFRQENIYRNGVPAPLHHCVQWTTGKLSSEELSDAWQWDLAYESRAWIEAESHWNEYDQMDVWVNLNERKKNEELWELLGLEPVSLMIKKSSLRWFGHVEWKDDNDWVKRCITWQVEGIRQRGRPKKTWWDCVKKDMESLGLSQKDAQSRNKWSRRIKGATS